MGNSYGSAIPEDVPRLRDLPEQIENLRAKGILRVPEEGRVRADWAGAPGSHVDASTNDYLGLGRRIVSRATQGESRVVPRPSDQDVSRATSSAGDEENVESQVIWGSGASRLIHGTTSEHLLVELAFARWVGVETSLLFGSGYSANVGALSALLDSGDIVVSDALNHASLIDGIRLSRARVVVTPHLDLSAVEDGLRAGATWVVVEGYYSMDGDGPDLGSLRHLCDRFGACLYVDEAHSLGTFGPGGAGLCAAAGIIPDVIVGTFGKAIGSYGAAVGGSATLRTWLYNRARSFVFSTAPSPKQTRDLLGQMLRAKDAESERHLLAGHSQRFRSLLQEADIHVGSGTFGPIVGINVGGADRALVLAERLLSRGILTQAIRPPTVPSGQSRIRVTLNATWSEEDVDFVAKAIIESLAELPIVR